jgi:hypothetical protein
MPLVDFKATVKSYHGFTGEHPVTGQMVKMRCFELRSLDPENKMRTITMPLSQCQDLHAGHVLRIRVEVTE